MVKNLTYIFFYIIQHLSAEVKGEDEVKCRGKREFVRKSHFSGCDGEKLDNVVVWKYNKIKNRRKADRK